MFSYDDYYKLLNTSVASDYQQRVERLEEEIHRLKESLNRDRGFREKKTKYLLFLASFLKTLVTTEQARRDAFRMGASQTEYARIQKNMLSYLEQDSYAKNFFNPAHAVEAFGENLGPYMSALAADFTGGIEDALKSRRYALLKRLDFYFTLSKDFDEQRITPESVQKLLVDYKTSVLKDELTDEFLARTGLDRSAQTTLSYAEKAMDDWADISYLYRAGIPIDANTEALAIKVSDMDSAFVEEKVGAVLEAIKRSAGSNDKNNKYAHSKNKQPNKLSLFCFSLGTERVVSAVLKRVREEDIPVDYLPVAITTYALPTAFIKDHEGDASLYLTREYADLAKAEWNALEIRFSNVLGQLHSDFLLRINQPYNPEEDIAPFDKVLTLSEEQKAMLKEIADLKRVSLGQTLPGHYFNELTYTLVLN